MIVKQKQARLLFPSIASLLIALMTLAGCGDTPTPKPQPTFVLEVSPGTELQMGKSVAIVAKVEPLEKLDLEWSVSGTAGGALNANTGEQVVYTAGKEGVDIVVAEGTTVSGVPVKEIVSLTVVEGTVTPEIPTLTDTPLLPTDTPVPPNDTPVLPTTDTPIATNALTPTPTPSVVASRMVALKTYHNRYVTAMGADRDWVLRAETTELWDWEKFTLLCLDNGKVALKTHHDRYVTAMNDQPGWDWELRAETKTLSDWEKFTLVEPETEEELLCSGVFRVLEQGDIGIALKTYHGRYVTAMGADRDWVLRAETAELWEWEKFTVIPLPTDTPLPGVTPTLPSLSSSATVVNAIRADQPPTIDGRLGEEVWSQAQPLIYAVHPPANDSTTVVVRLLWDDKYLYVSFDVSDTQVEDSSATPWDGDSVSAIIDNGGQIQEYRHSLLAYGSQSVHTGYHLKGTTTFNNPSDQDEGYSIEMRIPWVRTPAEGSTIAADFLSVDHDYNPGGLFNDRDTVFSKISWDGDASVDTAKKSILLSGQP